VRAACWRDLAALTPANTPAGHEATILLEDLALLWEALTDEEKNTLYRLILDGVYVLGQEIERVEPRPPFRVLLDQATAGH
jgi:hypothetical protein